MTMDARTLRLMVPGPVRRLPADLTAVLVLDIGACLAIFFPVVSKTPLRVGLGLMLALFAPGYALTAALFPERADSHHERVDHDDVLRRLRSGAIGGWERLALSLGLSLVVVPLLGMGLNFTPFGIRLTPVVVSVGVFTAVAVAIAATRRWALPAEDRFRIPYRDWYCTVRTGLLETDTRTDRVLNVALAISLILALGSVGYAVTTPKPGQQYTEFYLLTGSNDGVTADDYPTTFARGEGKPLTVGVSNHEGERTNYTVIVELQHVAEGEGGNISVLERRDLHRFQVVLGPNETWHHEHTIRPTTTGRNLRLQYRLYQGSPPAEPRPSGASQETHLWVNVTESGDANQ